jgi:hypothetical protein
MTVNATQWGKLQLDGGRHDWEFNRIVFGIKSKAYLNGMHFLRWQKLPFEIHHKSLTQLFIANRITQKLSLAKY